MFRIGLCGNWNDDSKRVDMPQGYVDAVISAGAVPLVFPLVDNEDAWKAMIDSVDGVIFTGGDDIDPALFGQLPHPKANKPCALRDKQEFFMHRYIQTVNKPYLCICRGMQTLNVVQGGTLYQDIEDLYSAEINHARFDVTSDVIHHVNIKQESRFGTVVGAAPLAVNSRHHQAVHELGHGLRAVAWADDGIVEAIEFISDVPCIAVQWHPELLFHKDARAKSIFTWLIDTIKKQAAA